jgi:hypothetical protein
MQIVVCPALGYNAPVLLASVNSRGTRIVELVGGIRAQFRMDMAELSVVHSGFNADQCEGPPTKDLCDADRHILRMWAALRLPRAESVLAVMRREASENASKSSDRLVLTRIPRMKS